MYFRLYAIGYKKRNQTIKVDTISCDVVVYTYDGPAGSINRGCRYDAFGNGPDNGTMK